MLVHSNAGHKSTKIFILLAMLVKSGELSESSVTMEGQNVITGLPFMG